MPKVSPRTDRLSWPDYHMLLALVAAQRSPDPNTQVGAVVVDNKNRILGLGYNGFPRGICVKSLSWSREDPDPLQTKYPYVVHAEKNAIYNSSQPVTNAILYVSLFPCAECAKDIIQAGIKQVIYLDNPYKNDWSVKAADKMFQLKDIFVKQHSWNLKEIKPCLQKLATLIT